MQSLAVNGYAAADVLYALRGVRGRREWKFRYELLSATNVKVADLSNVAGGQVRHDGLAEVKRTAKFTVRDDGSINFASQRIKPWCCLKMPDGGWAEWPQGVFLLTTPNREIDVSGVNTRAIDAYDQTMVIQDDTVSDRYYVSANYLYTDAINELLAGFTFSIPASTKRLPVQLDWEPGTPKYKIIADLLGAINYTSLWFDGNGTARAAPYVAPSGATAAYDFLTDQVSILYHEAEQTLDFYKVPNRLVLVVSTPDRPALRSVVVNTSATSPTSTVNRGRTITEVVTVDDVADQATLNDRAATLLAERNSIFEHISFETALFPVHENLDVYNFNYTDMVVSGKYSETSWEFTLEQGAKMKHAARKTVTLA